MTVEQLINLLKEMPKDKQVYFWVDDKEWFKVTTVFTDSDSDVGLME